MQSWAERRSLEDLVDGKTLDPFTLFAYMYLFSKARLATECKIECKTERLKGFTLLNELNTAAELINSSVYVGIIASDLRDRGGNIRGGLD